MAKIILDSWREGLEKITLTKLQVIMLGKSLTESKFNVDSLLDNRKVIIEIDNIRIGERVFEGSRKNWCKF